MKTLPRPKLEVVAYGFGGRDIDGNATSVVHPACKDGYIARFGAYGCACISVYHCDRDTGERPSFYKPCEHCGKPFA
jgi:hypothetical protein